MGNIQESCMDTVTQTVLDYITSPKTDFALLITGPWGCGKTYFWRNVIEPKIKTMTVSNKKLHPLYASFYGCKNLSDVDSQLFFASYPKLKTKWISKISGIGGYTVKNLFKKFTSLEFPSIDLGALVDTENAVLCFDDLERTVMPNEVVLGYINAFVEHKNAKVVILCNENEISSEEDEKAEYRRIKEKLIGETLDFKTDPKTVLHSLFQEYKGYPDFYTFISKNEGLILALFKNSQTSDIRSLRRALVCLYKVFETLSEGDIDPNKLPEQLIYAVVPTAFELCAHGADPKELRDIHASDFTSLIGFASLGRSSNESGKKSYQQIYSDRYFETFDMLDYKKAVGCPSICEYLITGFLDKAALLGWARELIRDPDEKEERIKLLLSDFREMDDHAFGKMCSEVLQDVESGNIESSYTYVRLFDTFQWFTEVKLVPLSIEQVMEKFKKGIDKACQDGTLKYNERLSREVDHPINDRKTEEHTVFCKYALEVNEKICQSQHRTTILDLAKHLEDDSKVFFDAIASDEFRFKPIFQELDIDSFVKKILSLPNPMLSYFGMVMHARYLRYTPMKELTVEVPVLTKMKELFGSFCQESQKDKGPVQLSLFHIQRIVKNLEEIIEVLKKIDQPEEGQKQISESVDNK